MEEFESKVYYCRIGSNIRRKRLEKGMTQEGLAEASGLSLKMVQKLEAGQQGFRMETILRIAVTLKVSLDNLADIRKVDERLMFQQEAFYTMTEDKTIDEIKYAIGIMEAVFKLHKKHFG